MKITSIEQIQDIVETLESDTIFALSSRNWTRLIDDKRRLKIARLIRDEMLANAPTAAACS